MWLGEGWEGHLESRYCDEQAGEGRESKNAQVVNVETGEASRNRVHGPVADPAERKDLCTWVVALAYRGLRPINSFNLLFLPLLFSTTALPLPPAMLATPTRC